MLQNASEQGVPGERSAYNTYIRPYVCTSLAEKISSEVTQEICVCSCSHVFSSELDLLELQPFAMWRNLGSLRAQCARPPVSEGKPAYPKKPKTDKDTEEEQHEDPIKLRDRESDLEDDEQEEPQDSISMVCNSSGSGSTSETSSMISRILHDITGTSTTSCCA